jgi:type II secretory pathway pseudopilin PulG
MSLACDLGASERSAGFSLIEVMVAGVVAVIAVLGLAYSFSTGRGMIDRYATARDALEAAQSKLDFLAMEAVKDPATADLNVGNHGPYPRALNGNLTGRVSWSVVWVDDLVDNFPPDQDPNDYKRAVVTVSWKQGSLPEQVSISRSFLGP